jgi:hypothetical protein
MFVCADGSWASRRNREGRSLGSSRLRLFSLLGLCRYPLPLHALERLGRGVQRKMNKLFEALLRLLLGVLVGLFLRHEGGLYAEEGAQAQYQPIIYQ